MSSNHKIRVGVVRGGPSSEYEVSLKSGATVLKNLPEKYEPFDVFIDKGGVWHVNGVVHAPEKVFRKVDVIFIAMHGEYGEDGQIQQLLESHGVPFGGSRSFPSRLAMNKGLAKEFLIKEGMKTPAHKIVNKAELSKISISELFRMFPQPSVIKPNALGSSVGVSISKDYEGFEKALKKAFELSDSLIVEEFIKGREATCAVVEGFQGEEYKALPPIEIIPPPKADFFDYEAKYGGESQEICPGNFSEAETKEIQRLAVLAHRGLGLSHYSRSDFIVHPTRGIFFLETNTLPGLTAQSLLPKSVYAVGAKLSDFLDHILTLAIARR